MPAVERYLADLGIVCERHEHRVEVAIDVAIRDAARVAIRCTGSDSGWSAMLASNAGMICQ
jgi:hypothetical protein